MPRGYNPMLERRLQAVADYGNWIAAIGESVTVYLLAVEAQQPIVSP
ncbi:hypothetical protein [Spirosoma sp. KCTC 42546]|nr:hypothetical protein [Spirosoma sp. KCTC 42546]